MGVGLSLLSAAVTNRGGFPRARQPACDRQPRRAVRAHAKTTSIEIGMDALQRTSGNERLLTSLGSPEGLISQIIRMPTSIVVLKEMGSFCGRRPDLLDRAEAHNDGASTPLNTRPVPPNLDVEQPCLCLLGRSRTSSPYTTEDDWTGGFSRCILISATKWLTKKGLPDSDQRSGLPRCWRPIHLPSACGGPHPRPSTVRPLGLGEPADLPGTTTRSCRRSTAPRRHLSQGRYLRLDIGDATPGEGGGQSEATQRAINFCKWIWVRSFNDLAASVALRGDGELLARVEQTILNAGHDGCTHGYLVRSARRLKRRLEEAIMTLKEGERIVQGSMSDGTATYTHTNFSGVTGAAPTAEDMA